MGEKRSTGHQRRVKVTLSQEVWDVVAEIHRLTDTPRAAIISELLDQVMPALKQTMEAIRIAKEQPREAQRLLQRYSAQVIGDLAQGHLELDDAIDGRTVEGQRAKRRSQRAAGST